MSQASADDAGSPSPMLRLVDRRHHESNSRDEAMSLLDYWHILKRRRFLFVGPAIIVFALVGSYVFSLPKIYKSQATILIEDQEIPEDIVGATIRNYASEQIQLVSQRLFTVHNIVDLVDKLHIYDQTDEKGNSVPDAVLASRFREDMKLDLVSADVINSRGQSVEAAVAFTLSFSSRSPGTAQRVTEELVSMFLNENQRSSAMKTKEVSAVLTSAIEKANQELLRTASELADFKAKNEGALPELYELNLGAIDRNQQQLSDVNRRIQELQQRKLQLGSELASLSPSAPLTLPSGETVVGDRDRLRALEAEYRSKSTIYQPGHPDLVRLKREIESLRATVGDQQTYPVLEEQLRQERDKLAKLRERYSEDYPDIKQSEATIAKLEKQLSDTQPGSTSDSEAADNPAYILIKTQLRSTNLELQNLTEKRIELQKKVADYEALIKESPRVEMQYDVLSRAHENARAKYSDLQAKLRTAQVAANMEQEITGQRFRQIEPPMLPIQPEDQNQRAILFLGIFLALGAGAGAVVLAEFMDSSIRSARSLTNIVGAPPLSVIPYLDTTADLARSRSLKVLILAGLAVFAVASIIYAMYWK